MLHRGASPNRSSPGRRSFSGGGLFADGHGIVHIRVPHKDATGAKSHRLTKISLVCERGFKAGVEEVHAAPAGSWPTCVRCVSMVKP